VRGRIAREQLAQIRRLNHSINQLRAELAELVTAHRPKLLAEQGCGVLTAAILIGHTAGNERFRSDASFALQTPTAPIPCSSGQRTQHRLNRGWDRQLNHALHIIAVTRAQRDLTTKEYLARKAAEGKTTRGLCAASSATSPAASTASSPSRPPTSSTPLSHRRSSSGKRWRPTGSRRRSPNGANLTQTRSWSKAAPRSCPA
jgi:transposase